MAFNFVVCKGCKGKFRNKNTHKPFVGYYNREPVYKHFYSCPSCNYEHVIRLYHPTTNKWYDEVMCLDLSLCMHQYNIVEYQKTLIDYEIAIEELNKANNKIKRKLGLE
ncbi:hypothetical protein [Cytobacillus horneckiae]|uniref:Uncharacterized protein n=1 Tax=Cytobacillus horneckiae TaxID=549687 RepID=A0A2N0ZFD4_9BACI|nr:hypothetical protein [Cytobacillus horneckiae]MEC1155641.1 hypothetical protein [Cytobacillus horneckiae]MED2936959.1 hypothetical protein [Cytobacillus horneckiae]PKG28193.1 hypothetical protein CWS20_15225 [Cytobacillus horneckiae]